MQQKRTIPRVCRQCGADFLAPAYKVKCGKALYCCHVCALAFQKATPARVESAPDGSARVPLLARDGSIRAYATIDADDAEWVSQWAWRLDGEGSYAVRGERRNGCYYTIRLHRELLGLPRIYDGREGDHIDRVKLNCRRSNLRIVPHSGNAQNVSGVRGSSSSFRGVTWDNKRNRWIAKIGIEGRYIYIGSFKVETEAAQAVRAARLITMPFATD